jgi:solute carrier family 36 (proton-coupled amino acid transporter)
MINPTNTILENWFFPAKASTGRRWARNLSRFLVVVSASILAVFLAEILDKFFGLIGALLCAPLAFMFPAMLHLRLIAKTKSEQMVDWLIIILSIGALIFCVSQSILSW